jgi:hypothetical protein
VKLPPIMLYAYPCLAQEHMFCRRRHTHPLNVFQTAEVMHAAHMQQLRMNQLQWFPFCCTTNTCTMLSHAQGMPSLPSYAQSQSHIMPVCTQGHLGVVQLLLEMGANTAAKTPDEFYVASPMCSDSNSQPPPGKCTWVTVSLLHCCQPVFTQVTPGRAPRYFQSPVSVT